jgi:hypothetical protein
MEALTAHIAGNLLPAIVGGGICGLIIAGVVIVFFNVWLRGVVEGKDKLELRVNELESTRLVKLEDALEEHIKEDISGEISNELKHITGSLNKLSDKIDRFAEVSAAQGSKIEADHGYIENVNRALQDHKRD